MSNSDNRISILDSFRAIAILCVMLFHYYHRWSSFYPYLDKYDYFTWGYYGVPFFFVISGFVIFYTLERTATIQLFWKKRLTRLYPSMIVASVLIFVILTLFDKNNLFPDGKRPENFIQSLTFLPPRLFTVLFHINGINYLNSSFWSLWPEIQFYLLASCIYFCNKEKFIRNFLIASSVIIVLNWILKVAIKYLDPQALSTKGVLFLDKIFRHLNITDFIMYFAAGVIFSIMFKNKYIDKKQNHASIIVALILLIVLQLFAITDKGPLIVGINVLIFALFLVFIYFPKALSLINNNLFAKIGLSSYFLYLIHEPLGVLAINILGPYFKQASFLFPILVMIILSTLSILYYEKVEKKIMYFLKSGRKKKVNVIPSE